jgi:hypothetical protein
MLDATQHYAQPLDLERIFRWHRLLSPVRESLLPVRMRVGELRGNEPMQVVSGRLENPTVHVEAPPRDGLETQVDAFLAWFAQSANASSLDPLLLDITAWLSWFLQTLLDSLEHALLRIDRVLGKARFWRRPPGGGRSTRYEIDWP